LIAKKSVVLLGLRAALLIWVGVGQPFASEADVSKEIVRALNEGKQVRLKWSSISDVRVPLMSLYKNNQFEPIWVRNGKLTQQAEAVIGFLSGAKDLGLDPEDYDRDLLLVWAKENLTKQLAPAELASNDLALSIGAMRYLSSLSVGRVHPKSVGFSFGVESKKIDLAAKLQELSRSEVPAGVIEELEPRFPIYQPMKVALSHYRKLAEEGLPTRFDFPPKFSMGMIHKDVPSLRRLLIALGDLDKTVKVPEDPCVFDENLAMAVRSFQSRHGLNNDGVIGRGTVSQLSVPIVQRVRQIELGLERLRWLPEEARGHYLIVNIPSFKLYGSRQGDGLGHYEIEMNVVVGQSIDGRATPVFESEMTTVTFRPYWNVPGAIAKKELLPEIRKNSNYLSNSNMELVDGANSGSDALALSPDVLSRLAGGSVRVRQKPGPKNALGLVKFSFPNTNNVYLHSTPSVGLFNRSRRDYSHGCIRVHDPVGLAEWVLKDNGDWPRSRIEDVMGSEEVVSLRVALKQAIPVYIIYLTVMAEPDGRVSFYGDIYGHDKVLVEMLAHGFPYPWVSKQ